MRSLKQHAIAADFVFDGTTLRRNTAVVIDGQWIHAVVPSAE